MINNLPPQPTYTPVPSAGPTGYPSAPQGMAPQMVPVNPSNMPPTAPQPPPQPEMWTLKFPSICSGILSVIECILTLAIIGCEIGSVLIDIFTATIYVGFWAGIFLMIAWISQSASGKYLSLDFSSR